MASRLHELDFEMSIYGLETSVSEVLTGSFSLDVKLIIENLNCLFICL